jgi:hypothetical protein
MIKALPVTITERCPNIRTGRTEIWAAAAPGWRFVRTEETGTPWYAIATDLDDTVQPVAFTSLRAAREAAAGNLREVMIDNARRAAQRRATAR